MGSETVKEDVKRLKHWLQQRPDATPAALKAGLQLLETIDLRAELSLLRCPVLSLYGRLDSLVPVAAAAEIQSLLPGCSSVIFPQAAHTRFCRIRSYLLMHYDILLIENVRQMLLFSSFVIDNLY